MRGKKVPVNLLKVKSKLVQDLGLAIWAGWKSEAIVKIGDKIIATLGKEVKDMPVNKKQFELDRIVNMLKSFDWAVVKSEFQGEKIIITMEKTVKKEA